MTYKLNEKQQKWIDALRSGEYEQGQNCLQSHRAAGDRFCCLGVACKVAQEAGVKVSTDDHDYLVGGTLHSQSWTREYFGFKNGVGDFPKEGAQIAKDGSAIAGELSCLTELNDHGYTFEDIADFVEEHPEWIFCEESLVEVEDE